MIGKRLGVYAVRHVPSQRIIISTAKMLYNSEYDAIQAVRLFFKEGGIARELGFKPEDIEIVEYKLIPFAIHDCENDRVKKLYDNEYKNLVYKYMSEIYINTEEDIERILKKWNSKNTKENDDLHDI